jgi:hypothetical protein
MTQADCLGINEFAALAGITRQRLHQLHQAGKGPDRTVVAGPDNRGRARKRGVPCIGRADGLRWLNERWSRGLGKGI